MSKLTTTSDHLYQVEFHLADHCNLNCQCCNHYSPIAKPNFPDFEEVKNDLTQLSKITDSNIDLIYLTGGEPLLNKEINNYLKLVRSLFPNTTIKLITNGIKLKNMPNSFWESCRENRIFLSPTKYPIKIDWETIEQKCKDYNIPIEFFNEGKYINKTSFRAPLDPTGSQSLYGYYKCHNAGRCVMLKQGKLYPCTTPGNVHILNEHFGTNFVDEGNGISIYNHTIKEIIQFLAQPIPFCRYCNLEAFESFLPWKVSTKKIEEWVEVPRVEVPKDTTSKLINKDISKDIDFHKN